MTKPKMNSGRELIPTWAAIARGRSRYLVALAPAAIAASMVGCQLAGGSGGKDAVPAGLKATRGDLTVTIGGVGRIVQAGESTQVQTTSAAATSTSAETPGFPVFPRVSGQVTDLLVASGQHVMSGDPLALLDDGGVAAAAISQAQSDVVTSRLELRQKRTTDPLRGLPPTEAELAAGHVAVASARARLARLLSRHHVPPT